MEQTPQLSGEIKDRLIRETYDRIQAYEEQGVPVGEALSQITSWLMEQEEVEQVMTYQADLTLRFVDGTQIGLLVGRRQAYGPPGPAQLPAPDIRPAPGQDRAKPRGRRRSKPRIE